MYVYQVSHSVTPECLLVTMDVNYLYTNIPHTDKVETCGSLHIMNITDQTSINDIPTLVDFILKQSFSVWRQAISANQWRSYGKKMAPTYTNMFMHYVENTYLSSFNLQPTVYFRYIDISDISDHTV